MKKKVGLEMRGIEPRTSEKAYLSALPIELHPQFFVRYSL